ncbi:hypothetical protein PsYK624_081800 [Phanerochaete sordida]|uniref:Uncharacterized protein n=1 Tax=Phanerochaete sordida TaxID=48140 RepID=A0A9P3GCD0_9APHY|nr:hypothetical protein PsYK624_081800 [Phanerochaete sordida]
MGCPVCTLTDSTRYPYDKARWWEILLRMLNSGDDQELAVRRGAGRKAKDDERDEPGEGTPITPPLNLGL